MKEGRVDVGLGRKFQMLQSKGQVDCAAISETEVDDATEALGLAEEFLG